MTAPAGFDAMTTRQLSADALDVVRRALAEDLVDGPDVTTTATVAADARSTADLVARVSGVVAGLAVAATVFTEASQGRLQCHAHVEDGAVIAAGDVLMTVEGRTRDILTAERTALNLLTHLSGVATLTRTMVDAVAGTGTRIRDSRKTLPGMRALQKHAVRCGGGVNHRMSLGDQALIKDNHIIAAGGVTAALDAVRATAPGIVVEIECDTFEQVVEAIDASATLILLDNMDAATMRRAVDLARDLDPPVRFEASGALNLTSLRAAADTGVDYLAVGALTHSAPALDIGLDLRD